MRQLILKETESYSFMLVATTEQGIKQLEKHWNDDKDEENKTFKDLYAYGCIDDVTEQQARPLIPIYKVHDREEKIKEYKCYGGQSKEIHNVIVHECPLSSLKCACELIGSKYFYILKTEHNGENSSGNSKFFKKSSDVQEPES